MALMTEQHPTIEQTKFGDVIIHSNSTNILPKGFDVTQKAILKGYIEQPKNTYLLENSKDGPIYATKTMMDVHPHLIEGVITGAGLVQFVCIGGVMFLVLVQVKGRPYIMNPA
jgi:hypothetical protein